MERDSQGWPAKTGCSSWLLLMSTVVIGTVGAATFVSFAVYAHNYHAAMWCLSSAIFSAAGFHLHFLNVIHRLSAWHDRHSLKQVKLLALMVCCLSTVSGAVYAVLAYRSQQEIDFGESNFTLSCVSAALSLAAGFSLFFTAHLFREHLLEIAHQRIHDEPRSSSSYFA